MLSLGRFCLIKPYDHSASAAVAGVRDGTHYVKLKMILLHNEMYRFCRYFVLTVSICVSRLYSNTLRGRGASQQTGAYSVLSEMSR